MEDVEKIMPYKDREKRKQVNKDSQRKRRGDKDLPLGVTVDGVTHEVPPETVPASYVQGLNGKMYETLPERPRYVTLSDGQVLDRSINVEGHTSGDMIIRMQAANESSYNFQPNEPDKAKVKAMIKGATNV